MTHVILKENGGRYEVTAKGHATGSVEACAAVSTLMYTLVGYLHNTDIQIVFEHLSEANAQVEFEGGQSKTVFDMVCIGFLELAEGYGKYVKVSLKTGK